MKNTKKYCKGCGAYLDEKKTTADPDTGRLEVLHLCGTTEIVIPFQGFYESTASHRAEEAAYSDWPGYDEKKADKDDPGNVDFAPDEFWAWYSDKHKNYELDVAKEYTSQLFGEIDSNIKPDLESITIDSPSQYNFTTDRIFIQVAKSDLMELYQNVDKNILAETVKEMYTSYDGFSSHYDNDLASDEWSDVESWDHNQWLAVINAIVKEKEINTDELVYI